MQTFEKQRIRDFLAKGSWFSKLPNGMQDGLIDAGSIRMFEASDVLSMEDQPAKGLFALLRGQVLVTRVADDDKELLIHIAGPGAWLGEIAMLTQSVPAVSITARTRIRTLYISAAKFQKLASEQPQYYRYFAELTAQRFAIALRQLASSLSLSTENLLRLRLADYALLWRNDGYDEEVIELALSQEDLARMIGASRQTVNRCLAKLQDEGLVEIAYQSIKILDAGKLRNDRCESNQG